MNREKVLKILLEMTDVLDRGIGDTDPNVDDLTEDEIIDYEPNYWLMCRVHEIEQEVGGKTYES